MGKHIRSSAKIFRLSGADRPGGEPRHAAEAEVKFDSILNRDREKTRLEKEFKRSDQRLDVLIDNHRDALIRAMQDFNKISTRITSARDRVKQVRNVATEYRDCA